VLRHVVCMKSRPGTDPAAVDAFAAVLAELPARIPVIRNYRFGKDVGLAEGNVDFAIVADFDDLDGWREYIGHPDHQRVIDEHARPIVEVRTAVQHELPV
jgi:hypothetical protein